MPAKEESGICFWKGKEVYFSPGDMELNIEDTSCPGNKTPNWRYAIINN